MIISMADVGGTPQSPPTTHTPTGVLCQPVIGPLNPTPMSYYVGDTWDVCEKKVPFLFSVIKEKEVITVTEKNI